MVPGGAVLGAFAVYWVLGVPAIKQEIMTGRARPLGRAFDFLAKYVYVLLAGAVVVCSFLIPGCIG